MPNLTIEPVEKGGELTFQQHCRPCLIVDVGPGKVVTIRNTRFILKGKEHNQGYYFQKSGMRISTSEIFGQDAKSFSHKTSRLFRGNESPFETAADQDQEAADEGQHECLAGLEGFFASEHFQDANELAGLKAMIVVKSGVLRLHDCYFHLDGIGDDPAQPSLPRSSTGPTRTVGLFQMPGTTCLIDRTQFKAGKQEESKSIGVLNSAGNCIVQNCQFHAFQGGAVISKLGSELGVSTVLLARDNAFVSCEGCGIYVEGAAQPLIIHNAFMACKCSGVILGSRADGFVALNEMQIDNTAVELINNKAIVYGNKIQKCHRDAIKISCNAEDLTCCPLIQRNYIEASVLSGIVVEGWKSYPIIKANVLEANRKIGIKLTNKARAHIGGEGHNIHELNQLIRAEEGNDSRQSSNDDFLNDDLIKEQLAKYPSIFEDYFGG